MEATTDHELLRFMEVWVTVYASLTYCYFISKEIPKGFIRLLFLLPIIFIFTILPLSLSSIILSSPTGFFIGWLANFNLLLLAFDKGPLLLSSSSPQSNISLPLLISLAYLPIKIKQTPSLEIIKSSQNSEKQKSSSPSTSSKSPKIIKKPFKSPLYYATKVTLLVLVLHVYEYKRYLHPIIIVFLYCFFTFLVVEIFLALVAFLAQLLIRLELEPHFNDPHLSTSLQNFWGRRWNLIVSSLLRATVYQPIRCVSTCILGKLASRSLAIVATFTVSGLMHELVFFYMGRMWPTWKLMWFFILHGVCVAVEIDLKNALKGKCQLHWLVTRMSTLGFVVVTGFWLFFPSFGRVGVILKMNEEIGTVKEYAKNVAWKRWVNLAG